MLAIGLALALAVPMGVLGSAGRQGGRLASSSSPRAGPLLVPASARGIDPAGAPHPFAIPAAAPPPYAGHYYAGTVYGGAVRNVSSLDVAVTIPDDFPQGPPDFYYVLLSAWDTAGSYDQIGFTDDFGIWGLAYSTTTECAGSYIYNPGAIQLTREATYRFGMSISGGVVTFTADENESGSWTSVFTLAQTTGGATFEIAKTFSCNGTAYYDLTDYEEVYATTGPVPPYDLFFTNNTADAAPVTAWSTFEDLSPSGVAVYPSSANTTIANEPFVVSFGAYGDTLRGHETAPPTVLHTNVTVTDLSPDSPISLSTYVSPAGWTVTFAPGQGSPPFTTLVNISFLSTTPLGPELIGVNATDGSGTYARLALVVNVVSALLLQVSALPSSIDLGQNVTFLAAASHGTPPYSYNWTDLPSGCTNSETATVRCAPSESGNFSVSARVTDGAGAAAGGITGLTVNADPQVGVPTASATSVDVGQPVTFHAAPTLGSGGFQFAWTGLPPGCSGSSATVSCRPTEPIANTSVVVRVTDAAGVNASSPALRFSVAALPVVGTLSPSRASVDEGQPIIFSASILGAGSGGDTLLWNVSPAPGLNCTGFLSSILDCRPTSASAYNVSFTVTDSNGGSSSSSIAFQVFPAVAILSFVPSLAGVQVGNELSFNVSVSGGSPPLSYRYDGLPAGCDAQNASALSCRPTESGTFTVVLTVTDANGFVAVSNVTVTVQPAPPSSLPLEEEVGLLAGVVAIVAAVGVAVALILRRPR